MDSQISNGYSLGVYQNGQQIEGNAPYLGFKGRMFPLLGFITGGVSIIMTYEVAVNKNPPDVKHFPWTDITHTGIHFPEYIILRIGLLVAAPIFCISFQLLKNYLNIKSVEILGHSQDKLNKFGPLSVIATLMLCVSTATISDGGDMNWTLHTVGATSFFIIALYLIIIASKVYRDIWPHKHFCPYWSYQIKKYTNFVIIFILFIQIGSGLKWFDVGSFDEWFAAFFVMFYFLTLYWDFKNMDIVFARSA